MLSMPENLPNSMRRLATLLVVVLVLVPSTVGMAAAAPPTPTQDWSASTEGITAQGFASVVTDNTVYVLSSNSTGIFLDEYSTSGEQIDSHYYEGFDAIKDSTYEARHELTKFEGSLYFNAKVIGGNSYTYRIDLTDYHMTTQMFSNPRISIYDVGTNNNGDERLIRTNLITQRTNVHGSGLSLLSYFTVSGLNQSSAETQYHEPTDTVWLSDDGNTLRAYNATSQSMRLDGSDFPTKNNVVVADGRVVVQTDSKLIVREVRPMLDGFSWFNGPVTGELQLSLIGYPVQELYQHERLFMIETTNDLRVFTVDLSEKSRLTYTGYETYSFGETSKYGDLTVVGVDSGFIDHYTTNVQVQLIDLSELGSLGIGQLPQLPSGYWIIAFVGAGLFTTSYQWLLVGMLVSMPVVRYTGSCMAGVLTVDAILAIGWLSGTVPLGYVAVGTVSAILLLTLHQSPNHSR